MTEVYDNHDPNVPDLPDDVMQFQQVGYIEESSNESDENLGVESKRGRLRSVVDAHMSVFERRRVGTAGTEESISPMHSGPAEPSAVVKPPMLPHLHIHPPPAGDPPNVSFDAPRRFTKGHTRNASSLNASRQTPRLASRAGWEPGINVNALHVPENYDNPLGSQVTIVDYSPNRYKITRMEIHGELDRQKLDKIMIERPGWSKVRWINVSGNRHEAVKSIGLHHNLHRLAIEDMVFSEGRRTKAETYPSHTFCCLPLFKCMNYSRSKLIKNKRNLLTFWRHSHRDSFAEFRATERRTSVGTMTNFLCNDGDSDETDSFNTDSGEQAQSSPPQSGCMSLARRIGKVNPESIYKWHNPETDEHAGSEYLESRRPLASKGKALGIEQVFLFLTKSDTVISFFDKGGDRIETPVLSRIGTDSTILRETSDPSMLLQALIDCIADEINPIISEYRVKLDELQIAAVINPTMGHTQDLHLINAELTILRNTIVPITSLINSLRDHSFSVTADPTANPLSEEVESEAAVADVKQKKSQKSISSDISDLASMYLADVADHTMTHTQDLDVMRNNAKSMTELIFNTISIQSSDAVRLLSLVTVVFLPLTFLTGYYGMNFTDFSTLNNNVGYYWAIAVPFCVSMTFILMWQWVRDKLRNTKNQVITFWNEFQSERRDYREYKIRRQARMRQKSSGGLV